MAWQLRRFLLCLNKYSSSEWLNIMIRFNKKLYYKYFDLYRLSSFLNDNKEENRSTAIMNMIKNAEENGLDLSIDENLNTLNICTAFKDEILEFRTSGVIASVEIYKKKIPFWIMSIILPDFFDAKWLSKVISDNNVNSIEELSHYLSSKDCYKMIGKEQSQLYTHFVKHSSWEEFPTQYASKYNDGDIVENLYDGKYIKGNFHNHTIFSDGIYTIGELKDLAISSNREYIGISDHTQSMHGVNDETITQQHRIIDELNQNTSCKILKSVECEILSDGSLDLNEQILQSLDYTIIAIHRDSYQKKSIAEKRLIKAIENPQSNILAHPSARLHKKKIELYVDMYKIIDACIANNVAIEINGDADRLDLDPRYISYAIDKGAVFTLDSDTHLINSFKNINNAIHIATDCNIPSDSCLNTKSMFELEKFFEK